MDRLYTDRNIIITLTYHLCMYVEKKSIFMLLACTAKLLCGKFLLLIVIIIVIVFVAVCMCMCRLK